MDIKHLVISGGGPLLIQSIGIVQQLEENGIFKRSNIESIYGTSAGAIIGLFICLGYDWDVINNFMIERPWHNLYYFNTEILFNAFKNCGVYGFDTFKKSYESLFNGKDISIDITLKEFYEMNKIELHIFTFEFNSFKIEDISYLSCPDLKLLDALYMSCALPFLFSPYFKDDKCYIDGALSMNYPLLYCYEKFQKAEEILGIMHHYDGVIDKKLDISQSILDYATTFMYKLIRNMSSQDIPYIKYQVNCYEKCMSLNLISKTLNDPEQRKLLLEKGVQIASDYIKTIEL